MNEIIDIEILKVYYTERDELRKKLSYVERIIELLEAPKISKPRKTQKGESGIPLKPYLSSIEPQTNQGYQRKKNYLSYEEAKNVVKELNLQTVTTWIKYVAGKFPDLPKKLKNIPSTPNIVYKDKGWIDWYDFLGRTKKKDLPKIPKKLGGETKMDVVLDVEAEMEKNHQEAERKIKEDSPLF